MTEKKNKKVILSIDNLKKYFVNQGIINKAVDGVSFDVHEGEIVGLIGESGSGKTTVGRTILRLYDEYNGFVRLEDKIISGKNISISLKKYLRKNVQMIFQDPHASLNSQQNIYTILKEPLLVNGIMKHKINDIFKDWLLVKKKFKYTFQIQAMKLELQNYQEINRLANPFFTKWKNIFSNFKFDDELSREDNFSSFYAYLEEKQKMESLIINNMYSNATSLINFYYEVQNKYRNKDLSKEELAYELAIEEFNHVKKLSKISKNQFEIKTNLKTILEKRHKLVKLISQKTKESKNTFLNYCVENKHEKDLVNIAKLMSTNLEFYSYNLKNEYLFKYRIKTLKQLRKELKLLDFEDVKSLVIDLEKYVKDFYEKYLSKIEYSLKQKKEITKILDKEFNFDFLKYKQISNKNEENYKNQLNTLDNEIKELKAKLIKRENPEFSKDQLDQAKNKLNEAFRVYSDGKQKFLIQYKKIINDLYLNIEKEKTEYLSLVSDQEACNAMYEKYKKEFFIYVKNRYLQKISTLLEKKENIINSLKSNNKPVKHNDDLLRINTKIKEVKKDLDIVLKMYNSDITLKEDTLKSFNIERSYLLKDIKRIYLLLGIDYKWVEMNLNKNNKDQESAEDKKWISRFNLFDYKISYPVAKYLISELLYKMIIYRSLEDVGLLKQFAYRYPHEFSGGQLQRIVIARALITEPKVIVADEPIASLDISIQAQVVNLLKDLCIKKNIGLIFIAHDLSMIEYVADNVQIMHLGKIVESGNTEDIYNNPLHPYTINLFKAIPKISNVNEKFQNVSFNLDYVYEQQFPNIPENYQIDKNHWIYGTKQQIEKWVLKNK
ncbi:ATP-binding cassette domain-containing protein [Metamycoplasma canadense]|uniref:Oligopeptide transport ATP-binding protein n=1 Tax=Metamycoplasma canadense TaxID=29554 RepID=A0A077L5K7_9BACT|nr:ATP-binding cassette domain-containing protein [Metamycoplasma canadense]BAP39555.1 oligopeptide transport ATP-binding protein [Metamycoplasma canadense]